jgi:hypothetical protein
MTRQPAGGMQDTALHVPTHKIDRTTHPWQEPGEPLMRPTFKVAEVLSSGEHR